MKTEGRKIINQKQKYLQQGEEEVLNYIGSEKHIQQIMKSGVSREEAIEIANDMRYNILATDGKLGTPDILNALGQYDPNIIESGILSPEFTFAPEYIVNKYAPDELVARNVHHEFGGHAATLGYSPRKYSDPVVQKAYEKIMSKWSPQYKKIYKHNESLRPIRKPEYANSTDPRIKYLEEVDEYSARARAEKIKEGNEGFKELYKYFTKESVDKLKNKVWLLLPLSIAISAGATQSNKKGGKLIPRKSNNFSHIFKHI